MKSLLLRTPDPHPFESILGYALRASEENGYDSPWQVLTYAEIEQTQMRSAAFPADKLAMILGKDPDLLRQHAYLGRTSAGQRQYCLLGHAVGRTLNQRPFRLTRPALCPACVRASGHLDACWDLSLFIACPTHRTLLVERCPVCTARVSWFRPGLLCCRCGSLLDTATAEASAGAVTLMAVLHAKIHDQALNTVEHDAGLPLQWLAGLSVEVLIWLILTLGKFSPQADGAKPRRDRRLIVEGAAAALADWPNGFHALLRFTVQSGASTQSNGVGLRKRFEVFYEALFKRPHGAQIEFLRQEFVDFGLREWGEATVDKKLLRGKAADARYVSMRELARRLGVRQITATRWMEKGIVEGKAVQMSNSRRYVACSDAADGTMRRGCDRIGGRLAARYIGLPVSVLRCLRDSGHYSACTVANRCGGYWPWDLDRLAARLLSTAEPVRRGKRLDSEIVSLERIMRFGKLGSTLAKAGFVASVLDGEITPVGCEGSSVGGLLFRTADVEAFRIGCLVPSGEPMVSYHAAAQCMGCGEHVIAGLVAAGHLSRPACIMAVDSRSLEDFVRQWVPLSTLVKRWPGSNSRSLIRLAGAAGLTVWRVRTGPSLETPFLPACEVHRLENLLATSCGNGRHSASRQGRRTPSRRASGP